MNILKIITIVNWVAIGLLLLLVGAETLFPTKGGDAAGQGMGKAIYQLAVIVLAVLLVLNLLPFQWSKYLTFGLIMIPVLYFTISPTIREWSEIITYKSNKKPWFEDKERESMAQAIFDRKPGKLKKLLEQSLPQFTNKDYSHPLLKMAIYYATNGALVREQLECIKLLLQAGASITPPNPERNAAHVEALFMGYPEILKVLLEYGADPNARCHDVATNQGNVNPIIFEAMNTVYGARECVRLLLEYGADPNAVKPYEGDTPNPSILLHAASRKRWDICRVLIEKGANPQYKTPNGKSLRMYIQEGKEFYDNGYSTFKDFEFVKNAAG